VSVFIRIQQEDFDVAAETSALTEGSPDIGAVVAFTGFCRNESGRLSALELEHYAGMAEAELARLAADAKARWDLRGVAMIHRFGIIRPGERIVLVLTASSHRRAAFEAAGFLMDYLKTRAPFWKQVESAQGTSWVDAKAVDDKAADRWAEPKSKPGNQAAE
jgi:molybdopterin synthase catalytic subunit